VSTRMTVQKMYVHLPEEFARRMSAFIVWKVKLVKVDLASSRAEQSVDLKLKIQP